MKHVWAHGPRSPVAQPSYNGGNWGNESNLVEADFALGINLTPGMKVRRFESHEMWSVSCHLVDGFHKLFVMNLTCVTWCNLVPSDFGYNHTSSNVLNYQGPNGVMVSMAPQLWYPVVFVVLPRSFGASKQARFNAIFSMAQNIYQLSSDEASESGTLAPSYGMATQKAQVKRVLLGLLYVSLSN